MHFALLDRQSKDSLFGPKNEEEAIDPSREILSYAVGGEAQLVMDACSN